MFPPRSSLSEKLESSLVITRLSFESQRHTSSNAVAEKKGVNDFKRGLEERLTRENLTYFSTSYHKLIVAAPVTGAMLSVLLPVRSSTLPAVASSNLHENLAFPTIREVLLSLCV